MRILKIIRNLYKQLIASSNVSREDYKVAEYNIASLSLKNNQTTKAQEQGRKGIKK